MDRLSLRRILATLPKPLRRQRLIKLLLKVGLVSSAQELHFNGVARAWVDLRDSESRAAYLATTFWPEFPPLVAAFLRSGGEMFDVGANFGLVTFGVAPLVPAQSTRFHLFEANSDIVALLRRSVSEQPLNTYLVNHCCVSDEAGTSRISVPGPAWGHGQISDTGALVPNLLLDDYVRENSVGRIAFLKMDVEGWESKALRGGSKTLSSGVVEAAFVEVAPELLRRGGSNPQDLLALLGSFGFDVYFCSPLDFPDPLGRRWATVSIHGTEMRFAKGSTLPAGFTQGDVLCVHARSPLSPLLRSMVH